MRAEDGSTVLNPSQERHLLSNSQQADKLLAEIESILSASKSKSAFRKYKGALAPAQAKVVEDYIARIRAQIVGVLESQGVALPEPAFESVHSMRVTVAFIRIAFEECTPARMRGYGDVPESKIRELNGLVDEMVSAVEKLDSYLAQGLGQNLEARLQRLSAGGKNTDPVKTLERVIHARGFVEFRPALSMIVDRLESDSFEIALFGRVSSGKSSLLNHIVQADILPVGVNPITSVPTRLVYGQTPRLTVCYADRQPQRTELERLPEFVSEHHNPGNQKQVSRIVAELPSARLHDGIVLVDTPGLGSLATAGAAETLAYLPRCDLGVVLIDAASTLTEDDLGTIQALYEAGVPALVLLSKSDLLASEDRLRSSAYMAGQIHDRLGLNLPIHPISVQPSHASLLEAWFREAILPLYGRHRQLAEESLARKIGSLREAVVSALKLRADRRARTPAADQPEVNGEIDRNLRAAVGRIAEVREFCAEAAQAVRAEADQALAGAARSLTDAWTDAWAEDRTVSAPALVRDELTRFAAARAGALSSTLRDLAGELGRALQSSADALGFIESHREEDFVSAIKEMPRLDLGELHIDMRPGFLLTVARNLADRRALKALERQIGKPVSDAFSGFGRMLDSWARRTLAEMQFRFESYADTYRAQLNRLSPSEGASDVERVAIMDDLVALAETTPVASEI